MGKGFHHYLNFTATVLIIVFGLVLINLLAYRSFVQNLNSVEAQFYKAGNKFEAVPQINFSNSDVVVVLALDTNCSYCDLSMPLIKKIVAKSSENPQSRVIALFDTKRAEYGDYLRRKGLEIDSIENAELASIRIEITPTIIIVNRNRTIMASYEGILTETHEREILELIGKSSKTIDS